MICDPDPRKSESVSYTGLKTLKISNCERVKHLFFWSRGVLVVIWSWLFCFTRFEPVMLLSSASYSCLSPEPFYFLLTDPRFFGMLDRLNIFLNIGCYDT